MQVLEVSNEDGKACAYLIQFLSNGSWNIKGDDAEKLILCKRWVSEIAVKMAKQLKPDIKASVPAPTDSSTSGFKVKGMGPLNSGMKRKVKKK